MSLKLGRYTIDRRLATGGMAEVLLARRDDGERVALKRVLPHLASVEHVLERFVVEARATAALTHPGIVRAIELIPGELPVLVLEHVAGVDARTLRARARGLGRGVPVEVVGAIVAAAADALAHAHARGVVHRDIKASNVLLAWDGRVKVADFGIAAVGEAADPAVDLAALARLAGRLSGSHDKDPPAPTTAGGTFGPLFSTHRSNAAALALALDRWLDERSVDGPSAIATLLAALFSPEERAGASDLDSDAGEPTPPLLGDAT